MENYKTLSERKISVIIPTYNRADRILKAISSVLSQTYPVEEVIVVDDCSKDNTQDVIKGIKDERVKYYCLEKNGGAGAARNFGVQKAKGDLIAFHDSDDIWVENKLEAQIRYLESNPTVGLVYSAYEMMLSYGIRHTVPDRQSGQVLEGKMLPGLFVRNTIGAPTMLLPRNIFLEEQGFDEKMRSLEDWDFAIRIASKYEIGFVPEALVRVAGSAGGVSSNIAEYYSARCYMLKKYRGSILQYGVFDETAGDILQKAQRDGVLKQVEKMMLSYLSEK